MAKKFDIAKVLELATVEDAAPELGATVGVSRDTIANARRLLKTGTPEQIQQVRSGMIPLGRMVKILPPIPKEQRQKSHVGESNRLRVEEQKVHGRIYRDLKTALDLLGTLPNAASIMEAIRTTKRSTHTPLRIREAANLLGELTNVYGDQN